MTTGYAGQAIQSVLNSKKGFCKFLSANDTGATGGHQSGILISKSAVDMLFSKQELAVDCIMLFGKLNDAFSVTLNVAILC